MSELSDSVGLATDIERYINDPSTREWMNHLMVQSGLLAEVPPLAEVIRRFEAANQETEE